METISPELALVDPDLAARARSHMPLPGDCLAPSVREVAPPAPDAPGSSHGAPPRAGGRPSIVSLLAGLVLAVLVGSSLIDLLPSGRGAQPTLEPASASSAAPASPTSPSTRGSTPITFRWSPQDGAVFYNFILVADGRRVLNRWPTAPRTTLSSGLGPSADIAPGRYTWYVYPAFARGSGTRYGAVHASGIVDVD